MKKMRNAMFALIALTGMLTACGESPMAPVANDVPLTGAQWGTWSGGTWSTSDTTATKTNENKTGPTNTVNSGYILGMD